MIDAQLLSNSKKNKFKVMFYKKINFPNLGWRCLSAVARGSLLLVIRHLQRDMVPTESHGAGVNSAVVFRRTLQDELGLYLMLWWWLVPKAEILLLLSLLQSAHPHPQVVFLLSLKGWPQGLTATLTSICLWERERKPGDVFTSYLLALTHASLYLQLYYFITGSLLFPMKHHCTN